MDGFLQLEVSGAAFGLGVISESIPAYAVAMCVCVFSLFVYATSDGHLDSECGNPDRRETVGQHLWLP